MCPIPDMFYFELQIKGATTKSYKVSNMIRVAFQNIPSRTSPPGELSEDTRRAPFQTNYCRISGVGASFTISHGPPGDPDVQSMLRTPVLEMVLAAL